MRAGDKILAVYEVDRTKIIGFQHAACFIYQSAQRLEVALGFEQSLGGDDNLLAGIGQIAGKADPVGCAQLLTPRTNHFTNINDV